MRLLNTSSERITEFLPPDIPPYVVLSHRWNKEEVSFREFSRGDPPEGEGLRKVEDYCSLARSQGFEWLWCDTICIDRSSSAELTEAINSMWSWYRRAERCHVYLADVGRISKHHEVGVHKLRDGGYRLDDKALGIFRKSVWFTRGWTLQELLAPRKVIFYNRQWEEIGERSELIDELSTCTGIGHAFLREPNTISSASIAMKMSWISKRATTREEDMAYCLMGLFDVNMPMLYGEGRKAFMRLQLEIIRKSPDESIFAWRQRDGKLSGLLAEWPTAFQSSGDVVKFRPRFGDRLPYAMTNQGLELRIPCDGNDRNSPVFDNYRDIEVRIAVRQGFRAFQLACGTSSVTGKYDSDYSDCQEARDNAVVIDLVRSVNGWQRTGDWKRDGGRFRDYEGGKYSMFYIPQSGL